MFMVNVSQALIRPMRAQWPELSVNDLKTWFRSWKYVVETLNSGFTNSRSLWCL